MRIAIAIALVAGLTGCGVMEGAPPVAALPPDTVAQAPEQGGKFIAFVGPRRQHGEPFLGVAGTNFWLLRSWLDSRSGERLHQLYVEDSYFGGERNWEAAHDAAGQRLKFVAIAKNEISCEQRCSYAEEFAAVLPEELLRASPQGLSVRFAARYGAELTIAVPGDLVGKQLAAVDAARATLPSAAAAPLPTAPPPR